VAFILVLDDDPEMRELMSAALEKEGHEVQAAETVAQAEKIIGNRLPEVMLLDLVLQDEDDGLVWLKKLQNNEETRSVPVIVVSAVRRKRKIVEGLDAGAVDYITKPFDVVELKVRVTAALHLHELRAHESDVEQLSDFKETARTIENEIQLPLSEIQRCLIQLRNESEDFFEQDRKLVNEAWQYFEQIEDLLAEIQTTGKLNSKRSGSSSSRQ
jgi:DNA-binding response OmpR family regulator